MRTWCLPRIAGYALSGLVLWMWATSPRCLALPGGPDAWVNVRQCGASGSQFETKATTTAGSQRITVAQVGDFQVGQAITVSRCNIRYGSATLWGPGGPYGASKPLADAVEIRGYDGSAGSWLVFILEVQESNPVSFRWSDNLVQKGKWTATKVPVTWDWQKLSGGIEVKFKKQDWQPGHMVTFHARDQLATVIEKIEGNVLTLRDTANQTGQDAVVRHSDQKAVQAAIHRAIKEKRNVFFPTGWYRIPGGLEVKNAAIQIEGADGVNTVLDISDGTGSCFSLSGGPEVTIRNLRLLGHTGLAEAPGAFRMSHGKSSFWACALKSCNAVSINGTERVLIENVHASRMSSECFYSQGPGREPLDIHSGGKPQAARPYTRSATYLRCTVTDCCANAFNNNDIAENTSVLYCRVDGVGWQAYEGPARFIKIIGNYIRNTGNGFWVGSMNHRPDALNDLGCGQAIISDNVIEGIGKNYYGIWVARAATQVVIANNLFINYNGHSAIEVSSVTDPGFPSNRVTVTGNIVDLTCVDGKSPARVGIRASTPGTIVSNNQVYVRGACDPLVTGISVSEPAVDVNVHDNLVRNCGCGLRTNRAVGTVTEVLDPSTFMCKGLPQEWKSSHLYRGWSVAWRGGNRPLAVSVLDSFDPQQLRYRLKQPRQMKVGDTFEIFSPSANWILHDNTITGCLKPVVLDSCGSETSLFRNNAITRGEAKGVQAAVEVRGTFKLVGNHLQGFDEKDSSALSLTADPLGRTAQSRFRDNVFEKCSRIVPATQQQLWDTVNEKK